MTTAAVRAYYATNRINTHASNELLFIVLGVVLGVMMLVLCVVMVMCACKQRQQRRLLGNFDKLCYHLEFRIISSYFLRGFIGISLLIKFVIVLVVAILVVFICGN